MVGEALTEMAAHGNVHLTKEREHFDLGTPELDRHVVHSKLAQTIPPIEPRWGPVPQSSARPARAADRLSRRLPPSPSLRPCRARSRWAPRRTRYPSR